MDFKRKQKETQMVQDGLGETLIQSTIAFILEMQVKACVVKRTPTVLVLQFHRYDTRGVELVRGHLFTYSLEFKTTEEDMTERINMFINDNRICTVTFDTSGITAFITDPKTGLMVRPADLSSYSLPKLAIPSPDYLDSYRLASQEYYDLNITEYTPNPKDDVLWNTLLLNEIDRVKDSGSLRNGEVLTHTYWLIHNDEYIGSARIRQRLTVQLWDTYGCNVFFEIRPSCWRRGYGTVLLQLLWSKAYTLGIDLLTLGVEKTNIPAVRLLNNSGVIPITDDADAIRYLAPTVLLVENEIDYSRFM